MPQPTIPQQATGGPVPLSRQTRAELFSTALAEGVAVATDDTRTILIEKIGAVRAATQGA